MRILLIIFVTIFTAGVINALMANDTETTTESVSEENSTLSENLREISANDTKEIKTLTYLLNGYHSILLRYEQEPLTKILPDNWRYNPQASDSGRPDPFKPKYTSEEALAQVRKIDAIFPIYKTYFNVTNKMNLTNEMNVTNEMSSTDVKKILTGRIANIESKLHELENHSGISNRASNNEKFINTFIYLCYFVYFMV